MKSVSVAILTLGLSAFGHLIPERNTDNYEKLPGERLTLYFENIFLHNLENTCKSSNCRIYVPNFDECIRDAFYFKSFSNSNITLESSSELDYYNAISQIVNFEFQGKIVTMSFKCGFSRSEVIQFLNSENINVGDIIPQNNPVIEICQNAIKNNYFNGELESSNTAFDGLLCLPEKPRSCYYENQVLVSQCYNSHEYGVWIAFLVIYPLFHIISLCALAPFCYYYKEENRYIGDCITPCKIDNIIRNRHSFPSTDCFWPYIILKRLFCFDLICFPCSYGWFRLDQCIHNLQQRQQIVPNTVVPKPTTNSKSQNKKDSFRTQTVSPKNIDNDDYNQAIQLSRIEHLPIAIPINHV